MKKKIVMLVFLLMLFPLHVLALEVKPNINCNNKNLSSGEQTECTLSVSVSGGKINGISIPYTYEDKYSIVKIEPNGSWQGDASGNKIDYYDYNDYSGNVAIAKVTYKIKENINVSGNVTTNLNFKVIEVADEQGIAHTYDNLNANVAFNIKSKSTTAPPMTTTKAPNPTTTKINSTTTKKGNYKTTRSKVNNKTTTTTTTKIEESTSTTKALVNETTVKKIKKSTTTVKKQEKSDINIIVIIILLLLLLLLLIAIIVTIKKEMDRRKNQS